MVLLAPRYRVLAADLWGAGLSPRWPGARPRTLDDEVDLLEPLLALAGPGTVLVGHSHGAAVALRAALRRPRQFRALALYEPTLFSLVDQASPAPNDVDGIRIAAEAAGQRMDRGDADGAARHFIDYWKGAGTWDATPPGRQQPIARSMSDVRDWAYALFNDPASAKDFASLRMPVLYMTGGRSPASSLAVARILTRVLPGVRTREFPGLGHMGPIDDPGSVNAAVERFLADLDAG
jgi:pimeloyl-ACP methyl ester carboxylesterase